MLIKIILIIIVIRLLQIQYESTTLISNFTARHVLYFSTAVNIHCAKIEQKKNIFYRIDKHSLTSSTYSSIFMSYFALQCKLKYGWTVTLLHCPLEETQTWQICNSRLFMIFREYLCFVRQ